MSRAVKFAKSIKIFLHPEEVIEVEKAIDGIIEMANKIAEVDTDGVLPLFYTVEDEYLQIDDEQRSFYKEKKHHESLHNTENIFQNAKDTDEFFFTSPLVIKK